MRSVYLNPFFIMRNHIIIVFLICCLSYVPANAQQTGKWGDQGDGTYRNPILPSDYSDPDVIRVGSDYYLISSTFHFSPGMVILHSKDMVNWETLGYAVDDLTKLGPELNWDKMNRYNTGIYAGSIRYHKGKFYIHFHSYLEGFFVATATNPAGPWKVQPMLDKNNKPLRVVKWDDVCPFWDDDGKAYLVSSKPNGAWYPHLFRMSEDGVKLLDADSAAMAKTGPQPEGEGTVIYDKRTAEGNKIYKINGYYYLFHNEVTSPERTRIGMMKRSKYIYGTLPDGSAGTAEHPGVYEARKMFRLTNVTDREPNQGGLLQTPEGKWYFITHQGHASPEGRTLDLLPVQWIDGWPIPGKVDAEGIGTLIWSATKPINGFPFKMPMGGDEFDSKKLDVKWEWNYQPRADKWSLTDRPGYLRLYAFKPIEDAKFFKAGNTISQRYIKSDTVIVDCKIDISHMQNGEDAGLSHFNGGKNYSNIGILQKENIRQLKYEEDGVQSPGITIPDGITTIWLRSCIGTAMVNSYQYSFDGKAFLPFGGQYQLKWGNYRGDYIGIYNFNSLQENGYIDVDWFHYFVKNK